MSAAGRSDLVARARSFVLAHGDALQRARAAALSDPGARGAVCALLGAIEDAASAATAIAVLDAIGVRRGAEIERAVALLSAAQRGDGSWSLGEGPGDGDAGDEAARVVTTAHIAGHLAKTPCARPKVLRAAGAFLAAHWSPEAGRRLNATLALRSGTPTPMTKGRTRRSIGAVANPPSAAFAPVPSTRARHRARVCACDAQALPGARLAADEVVLSLAAAQLSRRRPPTPAPVGARRSGCSMLAALEATRAPHERP
jgi:hypothetical protein